MKPAKLSLEKLEIINALLVGTNVTVDELFHSFELPAAHQCGGLDRRYLNISEACRLCSVSRFTIHRWTKKNWIRFCKLSDARGGRVLIEAASLFAFLESRSQDIASERNI